MPTKIIVPLLGEGIEEVSIVNWLKSEGDTIEQYDGLVEIETDKVVTEIPSPVSGTLLQITVPEVGQTVPVGGILAWIGNPGESLEGGNGEPAVVVESVPVEESVPQSDPPVFSDAPSQPTTRTGQVDKPISTGRDSELGFISPIVAKIASEKNIDLSNVLGTGLGGRITKQDLLSFIASGPETKQPIAKPPVSLPPKKTAQGEPGTLLPLTIVRKRIAEHMVMSKRTSAHVTTLMEADMSRVVAHRKSNKDEFAKNGARLTFTAYFVAATVIALQTFPLVNSSWSDDGILLHKEINIGMATDLGEEGLIVPVIKDADELSLLGTARTVNNLANRARSKGLRPNDVQGATFSITNHGVSGSLLATPIINQPQSAILGVGLMEKRVVVVADEFGNDNITIRPMVYLTLTFDHRILDGAAADHFLGKVVDVLENW
jgi:2-oxoglutarate dehydrogenase E2 component (dihydrolipoamide succinyltransferase)